MQIQADMYYFINEKTRKLVIAIVYVNDICFIGSKDFLLLIELKQKFEMGMLWSWKN